MSLLQAVVGDKPGLSVDTELVIGDKEQEVVVGDRQEARIIMNETGRQTAEVIHNDDVSPLLLFLLVLGWVLPTPAAMIRWMWSKLPFVKNKK